VTDKLFALESPTRKIREVQVGFKYITEEMLAGGVAMGFEESGGFGITSHIPERDGILFAMLMLEMLADSDYNKLSDFVKAKREKFGEINYKRIDFSYTEDDRMELLPRLVESTPTELAGFEITGTSLFHSTTGVVNGMKLRLDGTSRWLLIRSSETEPLLRFYAEGDSPDEPETLLNAGIEILLQKKKN